jgi:hypothetical protein
MRSVSLVLGAVLLCSSPSYAQAGPGRESGPAGQADEPSSYCKFALWVEPSYKYDLQSFWGIALGGALIGQAVADTVNEEKLQSRKNELEKALPPEAILAALQKADLSRFSKGGAQVISLMPASPELKKLIKSPKRSSTISSHCYTEFYITGVKANKTLIYGTLFDARFSIKQFEGEKVTLQYSDNIRRKIPDFPPETPDAAAKSYAGVQRIFSEQLEYYLKKIK